MSAGTPVRVAVRILVALVGLVVAACNMPKPPIPHF
jgi:hypothetical protein